MRLIFCVGILLASYSSFLHENKIDDFHKRNTGYHRSLILPDTVSPSGREIFNTNCKICHKDSANSLAPDNTILSTMTPRAVLAALDNGKMKAQGAILTEEQRKTVAQWVTQREIKPNDFSKEAFTSFSIKPGKSDYSGWGGNKEGTGFRTAMQSGITLANVSSLKLKWAFGFPDATLVRSKPAVAGDWLIVGGQYGELFAINKNTGKIGWIFTASAAIRGAISVIENANGITAFFADFSTNVYAVDVKTGRLLWNKRAGFDQQSTTTGSVAVYNGYVYVPISSVEVAMAANGSYACCTSSGGVVAIDAKTGQELWKHRVLPPAKESGKRKMVSHFTHLQELLYGVAQQSMQKEDCYI